VDEIPKKVGQPPTAGTPKEKGIPPRYASADLFQGTRTIVITHAGESYRLLLTRNNRLILQK
jgi:hemin uptake protein HemP